MGEQNVNLLEQNLAHLNDQLKKLESKHDDEMNKVEMRLDKIEDKQGDQQMEIVQMKGDIISIKATLEEIKNTTNGLATDWKESKDEQLKRWNNGLVKLFFAIVVTLLFFQLGLK